MPIKILIINDQADLQEPFDNLKSNGFSVDIIESQNEHIDAIHKMNPNVIIINTQQLGHKNVHLLPSIRAISKAPILILSVVDETSNVEKFLDRGADEYLVKPVSSNLLTARVKALARRSGNPKKKHQSPTVVKTTPIIN